MITRSSRSLVLAAFAAIAGGAVLVGCAPAAPGPVPPGREPIVVEFEATQLNMGARPIMRAELVEPTGEDALRDEFPTYVGVLRVRTVSTRLVETPELREQIELEAARDGATHVVRVSRSARSEVYRLYRLPPPA